MSDSEGPPPLASSSSDEAEDGYRRYRRNPPSSRRNSTRRNSSNRKAKSGGNFHPVPPPPPPDRSSPTPRISPGISHQREAAEFCLSRLKQAIKLQVGSCAQHCICNRKGKVSLLVRIRLKILRKFVPASCSFSLHSSSDAVVVGDRRHANPTKQSHSTEWPSVQDSLLSNVGLIPRHVGNN